MIQRKKRIVLFMPYRADPETGVRVCADLLPLELLQIAVFPDQAGYEVVLIDANVHDDYEKRIDEACDGALLFASSCILGFQVTHGARVAKRVRAKFPSLPILWGGWFPSCLPEQYLKEGIADAVGLSQGEFTFWDAVQAIDAGTDLADVSGLVVMRDGEIVRTTPRPVLGFDKIPEAPWHLLEYERYVEQQNRPGKFKVRHKIPDPFDMPPGTPLRGFSYFSSFGCPEPCTFCCSPMVTNRRWKAIPGKELAERMFALQDRFKFNVMRFQDANFGVAEKRSVEFCTELVNAGAPFWWNGTYEIETIARYQESSVDLLAESRFHQAALGAETGDQATQLRIGKDIQLQRDLVKALSRLNDRNIQSGLSWIIGYPGESHESMRNTLRVAAEIKHMFPKSASDIFPFRPIPGSADYDLAVELGYEGPRSLEDWGSALEYKYAFDDIGLPMDVIQRWKRYGATSSFYDGLAHEGSALMRRALQRISGWRLKNDNYTFPVEQKLFHWYVKLTGQAQGEVSTKDQTSGVTPHAPVA